MKIVSWNVNGLRSVAKKGFLSWLGESLADIVCLQEIKADVTQLPEDLINPFGYRSFLNPAARPGYSGVAIYSKKKPIKVTIYPHFDKAGLFGTGERFDNEGRFLRLDYDDFILINIYLPHGGRKKENLGYKLEVYEYLLKYLNAIKNKNIVIAGDFNVAHTEDDLARPKQNKNNIMATPEERRQLDKLTGMGFVDSFRKFHQGNGFYTWWPYFANARERNLGWRIDYVFTSRLLTPRLNGAFILSGITGSDHCPAGVELA